MNNLTIRRMLIRLRNDKRGRVRAEFKRNARIRLLNRITSISSAVPNEGRTRVRFMGLVYLKLATLIIIVLFLVSGSVVYTASFSEPGSALYSIKSAASRVFRQPPEDPRESATPSAASIIPTMRKTSVPATPMPSVDDKRDSAESAESGRGVTVPVLPVPTGVSVPTGGGIPTGIPPVATPTDILGAVSTIIPSPLPTVSDIIPTVSAIIP